MPKQMQDYSKYQDEIDGMYRGTPDETDEELEQAIRENTLPPEQGQVAPQAEVDSDGEYQVAETSPEFVQRSDPEQPAEVEYGSGPKKGSPGAGKKTGTDALKINVNTASAGGGQGGINV